MNAVRLQLVLTVLWGLMFLPSVLWWKDSVPFLVFVSVYANFVGHWASYEAAKAEQRVKELGSNGDPS
jgi:hypothetical protein